MFETKRVVLLTLVLFFTFKKIETRERVNEARSFLLSKLFNSKAPVIVVFDESNTKSEQSLSYSNEDDCDSQTDFNYDENREVKGIDMLRSGLEDIFMRESAIRHLTDLRILGDENDPNTVKIYSEESNLLRSRCQARDECEDRCPKKQKIQCKISCQVVFDNLKKCPPIEVKKPKKDKCKPIKTGKTMPPYWGRNKNECESEEKSNSCEDQDSYCK